MKKQNYKKMLLYQCLLRFIHYFQIIDFIVLFLSFVLCLEYRERGGIIDEV